MLADIDVSTLSPREAEYIGALRLFYADHRRTPHQTRALRYQQRMQQLYAGHLDDPEAAVFYALALLASADPMDKTYCQQFKAAGVLNGVRAARPEHPGVLHYLIHSYDYPSLAHLALDAATIYAGVAQGSAHAQHMPSHIFTRLGLWERSIASNHDASASAAEYTERANLPGHYDEGIHSMDYLMYALLQTGDDDGAKRLLDELRSLGNAHPENFKVAYTYAASPARYALERRDWPEASRLDLVPRNFPWDDFGWAQAIHHFARGIGSARSGQLDLATRELAKIRRIAEHLPADTLPYWREEVFVHADAVASWIALAEGNSDTALELAEAAADREDAVDKHPVTPGEVLPARELFGDMLLELGMPAQALTEYEQVLARSPNRVNTLMGAARASFASGGTDAATAYYGQVVRQTMARGHGRERFREAREYVSDRGSSPHTPGSIATHPRD